MPSSLANKNDNARSNLESAPGDSSDLASSSSDETRKVEKIENDTEMCCDESLIEISSQWLLIEPETEPCSGVAADSSRDFSSAPGDPSKLASGSSDAQQELSNDFVSSPATIVATDYALRLRAMQDAIQELLLPLIAREADESLLAIDEQLCLIECSITNAASALKTELQGGKLPEKA